MKKIGFLILLITILLSACKKKSDENPSGKWTEEEKASYQHVIKLQEQAGANLET